MFYYLFFIFYFVDFAVPDLYKTDVGPLFFPFFCAQIWCKLFFKQECNTFSLKTYKNIEETMHKYWIFMKDGVRI